MKPSTLANPCLYFILTLIVVASSGCRPDFGEKYEVKKTEIYYKDGATLEDAKRLGKKLEEIKFVDGDRKSTQLTKRGEVWEFRLATTEGEADEATKKPFKLICLQVSSAFDGDEVEVHMCNQKLETKTIVKGLRGKLYKFQKNNYYYQDVDLEKVQNFAGIAIAAQLDSGAGYNFHLSQAESAVKILMAYPNAVKEDKRLAIAARDAAVATSNKWFGGKQVDVVICDGFFEPMDTYSSAQKTAAATP